MQNIAWNMQAIEKWKTAWHFIIKWKWHPGLCRKLEAWRKKEINEIRVFMQLELNTWSQIDSWHSRNFGQLWLSFFIENGLQIINCANLCMLNIWVLQARSKNISLTVVEFIFFFNFIYMYMFILAFIKKKKAKKTLTYNMNIYLVNAFFFGNLNAVFV